MTRAQHHRPDPRYAPAGPVRTAADRKSGMATDLLTGEEVFVKTGAAAGLVRELRALLSLPEGIAPRVLDAVRMRSGELRLVEEKLPGRTLLDAAPDLPVERFPGVVIGICTALAGLHRTGLIHGDIKPANLFLLEGGPEGGTARLLDLGFSMRAWTEEDEEERGGTPPFMAPEVLRGWAVDQRADQFSLAASLRAVAPSLDGDPRWKRLLDRLGEPVPARRFPHVVAFREELERAFGLATRAPAPPGFGAGPLRSRSAEIARALEALARGPGLVLVQSRPSVGLTRFLLETAAACSGPLRILDLGALGTPHAADSLRKVHAFLSGRMAAGETILVGVPDPSPDLEAGDLPEDLRSLLVERSAVRLRLDELPLEAFEEITASSLGRGGAVTEALAAALHERSAGALSAAATGFESAVRAGGREEGVVWKLDAAAALQALQTWKPDPPPPSWDTLPESCARALRILARAGERPGAGLARELLARFGSGTAEPEELIRRGLLLAGALQDGASDALRFLHRPLWERALAEAPPDASEIDRWMLERHPPTVREADWAEGLRRIRTVGDPARESAFFAEALSLALDERRWTDVRRLLQAAGGTDALASLDRIGTLADALSARLAPAWPQERVWYAAGRALFTDGNTLGLEAMEAGAQSVLAEAAAQETRCDQDDAVPPQRNAPGAPYEHGPDANPGGDVARNYALHSLVYLAYFERTTGRMEPYARHLSALQRLDTAGCGPLPGTVDLELGRNAFLQGRREEAEALGRKAREALRGSGSDFEPDSLLFLAVLAGSGGDMEAALTMMREAERAACRADIRSMVQLGISQIHEMRGEPVLFAEAAQRAIDTLAGRATQRHLLRSRIARAWAWAHLDRPHDAFLEAERVQEFTSLRDDPPRLASVRVLAGYAALQAGQGPWAVAEMASAWEILGGRGSAKLRATILRFLLDALLDLEDWRAVRENSETLRIEPDPREPAALLTSARADALRALASGDPATAVSLLRAQAGAAAACNDRLDEARYFHHLGCALDAVPSPDAALEAAEWFARSAERFGPEGYGYLRAQALLGRARSLADASMTEEGASDPEGLATALEILDQVIPIARRLGCRSVLASALQVRAAVSMALE